MTRPSKSFSTWVKFDYCIRCLEYSPSAAGRRIQVARCIRRYPPLLELLEARELSLSAAALIASILTIDNYKSILEQARGASHRDVEKLVAQYRPPLELRDRVQPVRVAVPERPAAAPANDQTQPTLTPGAGSGSARIEQRLLVQFLASEELMRKLEEVKSLLSHQCPDGSFADIFDVIVSEYLERNSPAARKARRDNKKSSSSDSRRRECDEPGEERSRHIPDDVRDEVFVRDGGECAFVGEHGIRCRSRRALQVDHIVPYSRGGKNDLSNLRLLCGAHNRRAAEVILGGVNTGMYRAGAPAGSGGAATNY